MTINDTVRVAEDREFNRKGFYAPNPTLHMEDGNRLRHYQARREGGSFPGPRDVLGAPPSLKNTEKGVPDGLSLT